ncbi:MAG TPA: hypothetical protein VEM40_06885 [Nitrospirota bacterium]|nr:hypothetical protein [Nitrospirota bacterium]
MRKVTQNVFVSRKGKKFSAPVILLLSLIILTACSKMDEVTSADREYLFLPEEIKQFHTEKYQHKMTPNHVPYIFFKMSSEKVGFRGLYGTILMSPDGGEVKYLCLVNILSSTEQASELFKRMNFEPSPSVFGSEETVAPGLYRADEIYLYRDNTQFHMVIRSSRIVYTIYLDGVDVDEPQVRHGLETKIAYLKGRLNAID